MSERSLRFGPASHSGVVTAMTARRGMLGLLLWIVCAVLRAEVTAEFEAANRLYEERKYAEAAAAYAALAERDGVSANLCFNLGNAWFKAGHLGKAILSYRLAAALAPRDPDIEANLRMVRELVQGGTAPVPAWWRRLARTLTLNEWTVLAAVCLWVCCGLLVYRSLRTGEAAWIRRGILFTGLGVLVFGTGLLAAWQDAQAQASLVVTVPEASVRYGPLDVSPQLEVVTDGTELTLLDRKDEWYQVAGLKRGTGWIRTNEVGLLTSRHPSVTLRTFAAGRPD